MNIRLYISLIILLAGRLLTAQYVAPPEIIRVSVDTSNGLVGIYWEKSASPDIRSYSILYEIYTLGQPGWITADSVDANTFSQDYPISVVDGSASAYRLTVKATDSAGQSGIQDNAHSNMHLSNSYDSCDKSISLEWTSYVGWEDKLVKYEVYYSMDNGEYSLLAENSNTDTTALHLDVPDNHIYCYFIKAIKNDGTYSFSNEVCRNIIQPIHPAWINAESASVTSDGIELKFVIDPASEVSKFQLFKASGIDKTFVPDQAFTGISDSLVYTDPVVSTDRQFRYRLYSLDVCDNPVRESNVSGNIVLTASSMGLEAMMQWTSYFDYETGVKEYRVYRQINQEWGENPIGGAFPPDTTFEDDLSFLSSSQTEDEICYRVLAVENEGGSRGEQGFSWSNTVCVTVVPQIFMANAIIPNAMPPNNEIKPELTFLPLRYLFVVYDRWGNRIFETKEHEVGWDGRISGGNYVPEGVYPFYILLTTSNGIEVEKKGIITVFYK